MNELGLANLGPDFLPAKGKSAAILTGPSPSLAFVIGSSFLICLAAFAAGANLVMATQEFLGASAYEANKNAVSFGFQLLACVLTLGLMAGFLRRYRIPIFEYLAFREISWKQSALAVLLFAFFAAVSTCLEIAFPSIFSNYEQTSFADSDHLVLMILLSVVLGPFLEEIVFRGYLFRGLSESKIGLAGAVVITSLLWTVIHTQYPAVIQFQIFLHGIALCYLRVKTNSIAAPFLAHGFYNFIGVVLTGFTV